MKRITHPAVLVTAFTCLVPLAVQADTQKITPLGPLLSANAIDGDIGYLWDDTTAHNNQFWYSAKLKGQQLSQFGNAPNPTDVTKEFSHPAALSDGDTNAYSVNIEQGSAQLSGPIIHVLGGEPFTISLPILGQLRGSGQISYAGGSKGDNVNTSFGFETFPLHPLQWLSLNKKHETTDWLLIGAVGQRQSTTSSTPSTDPTAELTENAALITARMFIGQASYAQVKNYTKVNLDDLLAVAPTYADANIGYGDQPPVGDTKAVAKAIVQEAYDFPAPIPSEAEKHDPTWWKNLLNRKIASYIRARNDLPVRSYGISGTAWYTLSGAPEGSRAKAIFAAEISQWISTDANDRDKISVRFEDGFDSAAPRLRINRIMLTYGRSHF